MRSGAGGRRSTLARVSFGLALAAAFVALMSLGIWQLERRAWKLTLIEQIDRRVHAAPVEAPGPQQWGRISAARDAYRRVRVTGRYLNDLETPVRAVTRLGGGFWILTPLRTDDGFIVLINRGFAPPENRAAATRVPGLVEGETEVTGLLRVTEPGGAFLRANDPAADRWYSRDVQAIAAARRLPRVAPYFIDADDGPVPGGLPVGGLTVLDLPNNHLTYAITWFALATLLLGAAAAAVRGRELQGNPPQGGPGNPQTR